MAALFGALVGRGVGPSTALGAALAERLVLAVVVVLVLAWLGGLWIWLIELPAARSRRRWDRW